MRKWEDEKIGKLGKCEDKKMRRSEDGTIMRVRFFPLSLGRGSG
jgi:hypothetical protein